MFDYQALRAELSKPAYAALADAAARDAVAAAHPAVRPRPFTAAALLGLLDAAALAKLYARPALAGVAAAVAAQDRAAVLNWLTLALAAGDLTRAQHDAVAAAVTATEPDPAGVVALPGWDGPLTTADVAHARSL